jgi:hypothetical protein
MLLQATRSFSLNLALSFDAFDSDRALAPGRVLCTPYFVFLALPSNPHCWKRQKHIARMILFARQLAVLDGTDPNATG